MKKTTFHIITLWFAVSCGTEKPQHETGTKKEIHQTEETTNPADSVAEVPVVLALDKKWSFQQKTDSLIKAYAINYDEKPFDKRPVLLRFENAWTKQVLLIKKFTIPHADSVVFPMAYLSFYQYTDSAQRANAMSNWLACFGSDCNQVVPGEESTIKSAPGFYIINEKEIITLDYPREHEKNNWNEMKKNLKTLFMNTTSQIVEIDAKGKLKWNK